MILYHGSTVIVEKPEIRQSEFCLDFGIGFYTTTSLKQAKRWAQIKMRRENKDLGYVSIYEFDLEAAEKSSLITRFENADLSWLNFVVNNRGGKPSCVKSDMHIGPVSVG